DLLAALESGKCGGAAIDVYAAEPPPADSKLRNHPRLLTTPHLGASTKEAQQAVSIDAAKACMTYLRGEGVKGAVNAPGLKVDLTPTQERYADLAERIDTAARGFVAARLGRRERVAVYLPKSIETVVALFAATRAGGVMVPVNPVLRAPQVRHILEDAGATILVTSRDRYTGLRDALEGIDCLKAIVITDGPVGDHVGPVPVIDWDALDGKASLLAKSIDADVAALLYTSGSTGRPKGVVLSHRNIVAGAESVATYLENGPEDRILAVLPLSFDAGFSQLTTAFHSGATAVLHDYFLPRDLLRLAEREGITGITAVPPLWSQLAELDWPDSCRKSLRYFANTGGKMPKALLARLRETFPSAAPYLMYGLTEAFRSTYLPPFEVD
ncbi:MAG: AMP-binding protein, partial [Planctomycetota bacterium]